VPFFFFLSRYHISIQPTSTTTTSAITATPLPSPPPPPPPPPPSPPSSFRFHPYFHSIPSSPRFESSMRSPVRKKGALKRFLLAMGTPSPTPYRVYRVPHITNAAFLLSCHPPTPPPPLPSTRRMPPCRRSFFFLVLFLSRRLSHSFVLLPTSVLRPLPRRPARRKGQPLPRFRHPRAGSATSASVIREEGRR